MSDTSPLEKGNKLERAVAGIEAAIIQHNPALAHSNYRIETKKRITVDGVLHELDVFVTFDFGPHHSTSFIFECKNWNTKVDKNEVIILAEKVKALEAQQGFLVARSFSSSAEAQANKGDSRITLLTALVLLAGDGPWNLPTMRKCGPEDIQYAVHLIADDDDIHGNESSDLPSAISSKFNEVCQMVLGADIKALKSAGVVGRQIRKVRHTARFGPITVNGRVIRSVNLLVTYTFVNEEIPTEVVARFDIPGYGRHLAVNFDHPQRCSLRLELSAPDTSQIEPREGR